MWYKIWWLQSKDMKTDRYPRSLNSTPTHVKYVIEQKSIDLKETRSGRLNAFLSEEGMSTSYLSLVNDTRLRRFALSDRRPFMTAETRNGSVVTRFTWDSSLEMNEVAWSDLVIAASLRSRQCWRCFETDSLSFVHSLSLSLLSCHSPNVSTQWTSKQNMGRGI